MNAILQELINDRESDYLDMKRQFHSNMAELIHDILCLCNAYVENDRYLVFGVADDGKVVGIRDDPNRKTNAQIQDLIRQSHLNRIPTIRLSSLEYEREAIDILEIKNRPDKPFYLTKDKRDGKYIVRAGVIYTRIGDTNVPTRETAPDEMIELMWRERFGLGLSPLDRFHRLVLDLDNWTSLDGDAYLYHNEFPEFVIERGETVVDDFREPWSERFPDPKARSYYVNIKYIGTVLRRFIFVSVDGGRYQIPLPDRYGRDKFKIDPKRSEFKIALMYKQYLPLEQALPTYGLIIERED